jgi:DNA-binding NarL/FixJ family response regulator
MIQLLIVEDQPILQKGLHMRLAAEPDLCVVGETADCEAALDLTTSLCPDVVLVDVEQSRMDKTATVNAFHSICRQFPVIILSTRDDAPTRAYAAAAGAAAFISKSMPIDALLTAIRQVPQMRIDQRKGGYDTMLLRNTDSIVPQCRTPK